MTGKNHWNIEIVYCNAEIRYSNIEIEYAMLKSNTAKLELIALLLKLYTAIMKSVTDEIAKTSGTEVISAEELMRVIEEANKELQSRTVATIFRDQKSYSLHMLC